MTVLHRAGGVAAVALGVALVAMGSTTPLAVNAPDRASVRLAWSVRPERIEECRARTAEELARLPAHMRQPMECIGAAAEYGLTVLKDGIRVIDDRVHGAGLRRDRRLFVLRQIDVVPGRVSLDVRFDRIGETTAIGAAAARRARDVAPPHLTFIEQLDIAAGEVVLITYDPDRGALVARRR